MDKPRHIGIVGCSAEGAALCYRTICVEGEASLGRHAHPEVSMHTHSLADYVSCLERGDLDGVAALMLSSTGKLVDAGADFLICPDNTIHQAMHLVRARTPRPWLHIAQVVADEAEARGFRRLALTGTGWLMESAVYPEVLSARGFECVLPNPAERADIDRIILDELVRGRFDAASVSRIQAILARMKQEGCEATILGCTELPLILGDANAPLPILDSTRLLARAALRRAIG